MGSAEVVLVGDGRVYLTTGAARRGGAVRRALAGVGERAGTWGLTAEGVLGPCFLFLTVVFEPVCAQWTQ